MHTIDSFEVITLHGDGEVLLTTNENSSLSHNDGQEIAVTIVESNIVLEGDRGFRLVGVPPEAIDYLRANKRISLAEISHDQISRIAILAVSE